MAVSIHPTAIVDDGAQLGDGTLVGAGFADRLPVELGDLVGADHDGIRVQEGHGRRLGACQPRRQFGRRLAGPGRLVDLGRHDLERQAQALEQLAAVARGGSQDERRSCGHGRIVPSATVHSPP